MKTLKTAEELFRLNSKFRKNPTSTVMDCVDFFKALAEHDKEWEQKLKDQRDKYYYHIENSVSTKEADYIDKMVNGEIK